MMDKEGNMEPEIEVPLLRSRRGSHVLVQIVCAEDIKKVQWILMFFPLDLAT